MIGLVVTLIFFFFKIPIIICKIGDVTTFAGLLSSSGNIDGSAMPDFLIPMTSVSLLMELMLSLLIIITTESVKSCSPQPK
jgi:hypothetical protein